MNQKTITPPVVTKIVLFYEVTKAVIDSNFAPQVPSKTGLPKPAAGTPPLAVTSHPRH